MTVDFGRLFLFPNNRWLLNIFYDIWRLHGCDEHMEWAKNFENRFLIDWNIYGDCSLALNHASSYTPFELSKECEQKSKLGLSYHGHHKVEICAVKKQLWQVGVCEEICPNLTEIHTMRKPQNSQSKGWATYMKHFLLPCYNRPVLMQHQNHLDSSLSIRTCKNTQKSLLSYIGRLQPINNYWGRSARRPTLTLNHKVQRPLSPKPTPKTSWNPHI